MSPIPLRRRFLTSLGSAAAFFAGKQANASPNANQGTATPSPAPSAVPGYATLHNYRTLKQSSFDRTGGNNDSWHIAAGDTLEVFKSTGPGIITHIWYTISARGSHHLKELVMRIYWDGNAKPSVEVPVGDFFGLNLGEYFLYQSAFLNCSSVKALNCYFAMPFRREARVTITNEGSHPVDSFYSNIDYKLVSSLPENALYFHAQYRQSTPNRAIPAVAGQPQINLDGRENYVFFETRGRGQMMGVTFGVVQNHDGWFGEGDEMIYIDDPAKPAITGTGTEDYLCGAWDFNGVPFANLYNGAPFISIAERAGGRYCLYRWHADNPVAFETYLKHTIEHGHANDRADCFYSVGYWYQTEPFTEFPALPGVADRWPALKT
jgi:hypothetical protein